MTNEQKQVQDFMKKADQECPPKPTIPDLATRKLRARLMLEEVLETINDGLGLDVMVKVDLTEYSEIDIKTTTVVELDNIKFVRRGKPNLVELADGLADLAYVSYYGTANACGIDMEPIFQEVQKSNISKFIDGYKDENGKFRKGPSFVPPDIKSIIHKQRGENEFTGLEYEPLES